MPSKGTPARTIRIPNPEWKAAGDAAADLGSDLSAELRATVHQLATRRIKEIRMPVADTTIRCTWENPCATCAEINTSHGITEPSVVHNPWLLVPTRDLRQGDTVRDFGDAEHVLGEVTKVSASDVTVHWSDEGDRAYPTTGRTVKLLRGLREGELTFQQEMASR